MDPLSKDKVDNDRERYSAVIPGLHMSKYSGYHIPTPTKRGAVSC